MAWSRESRHARGYGHRWDILRAQVLRREPLCRLCAARGRPTQAVEVDHIQPRAKGGTDELANLQALCVACHRKKTAAEMGRRPRQQVALNGWDREGDE